jgi:hypothetical protein
VIVSKVIEGLTLNSGLVTAVVVGQVPLGAHLMYEADVEAPLPMPGAVGPAGPSGQSTSLFDYLFSTNTVAPPNSGNVELNNATPSAATLIWVHHITNANNDATVLLNDIQPGSDLIIQEKQTAATFLKYNCTSVTDKGTYTEYAVTFTSSGGTAIGNKDSIFFGVITRAQTGPPGPTGPQGAAGLQGVPGGMFDPDEGEETPPRPAGLGSIPAPGSDMQVFFNQAGTWGADTHFKWNYNVKVLLVYSQDGIGTISFGMSTPTDPLGYWTYGGWVGVEFANPTKKRAASFVNSDGTVPSSLQSQVDLACSGGPATPLGAIVVYSGLDGFMSPIFRVTSTGQVQAQNYTNLPQSLMEDKNEFDETTLAVSPQGVPVPITNQFLATPYILLTVAGNLLISNTQPQLGGPAAQITNGIRVLNNTGVLSTIGDTGYIDSAGKLAYTMTANLDGVAWCVVVAGGSAGTTVSVLREGQVTVTMNANSATGDYLVTSATNGTATTNGSKMRPEVFAVALTANSGGMGGQVQAMLMTKTRFVTTNNANFAVHVASGGGSLWTGTINGAPSTTSVTVTTTAGALANIKPADAGNWLYMRLWNTTRNSFRLITAINTATNVITTVASIDTWANTDVLTIESRTTTTGLTFKAVELDWSNAISNGIIPATARSVTFEITNFNTATIGTLKALLPYTTYAGSNLVGVRNPVLSQTALAHVTAPIINGVTCMYWEGGGTGTATTDTMALALIGYNNAEA